MAPQDDLTAERAAISLLLNRLNGYDGACITDIAQEKDIDLILQRDKQTHQEALREAARVVREWPWEQPAVHADPLRQARCRGNREASNDIADALDRLAREGG